MLLVFIYANEFSSEFPVTKRARVRAGTSPAGSLPSVRCVAHCNRSIIQHCLQGIYVENHKYLCFYFDQVVDVCGLICWRINVIVWNSLRLKGGIRLNINVYVGVLLLKQRKLYSSVFIKLLTRGNDNYNFSIMMENSNNNFNSSFKFMFMFNTITVSDPMSINYYMNFNLDI